MSRRNASIRVRQSFLIIATMRREESSPKDEGTRWKCVPGLVCVCGVGAGEEKSECGSRRGEKTNGEASLVLSRHNTSVLESCTSPLAKKSADFHFISFVFFSNGLHSTFPFIGSRAPRTTSSPRGPRSTCRQPPPPNSFGSQLWSTHSLFSQKAAVVPEVNEKTAIAENKVGCPGQADHDQDRLGRLLR
jgi:hypothetical protein